MNFVANRTKIIRKLTIFYDEDLASASQYVTLGQEFSNVVTGSARLCAVVCVATGKEAVSLSRDFMMS